jgi:hypothetical protein
MPKILVLDHTLNSESMASCFIEHKDSQFFGLNTSISIDENLQMCQPDLLFINQHFVTPELLNQMLNKFGSRAKIYNVDYLIPNYYVQQNKMANSDICIICLHENHPIDPYRLISINNYYPPIYSYDLHIDHPQFAGSFKHAKELFQICDTKNVVIDASGGYLEGFCKFYGWSYGSFKPGNSVEIIDITQNSKTYLSNKEIYEQNM